MLSVITFIESAVQKLLTLTIIYGESLWEAVDIYGAWIGQKVSFLSPILSARSLIWAYILCYSLAGIFVGLLIIRTQKLMHSVEITKQENWIGSKEEVIQKNNSRYSSRRFLIFWSVALIIISLPLLFFNSEFNGWKVGVYLVARSALILAGWYLLIGPLLLKGIQKLLSKKRFVYQEDIQNTLNLLPHLRVILKYAWKDSGSLKGLNRFQHFMARSIVYSVHFNSSES